MADLGKPESVRPGAAGPRGASSPAPGSKGARIRARPSGEDGMAPRPSDAVSRQPDDSVGEIDRRGPHLRPVWIVLLLLVPCLILTGRR